jgi:Zn-dependent alcohol dehydrogenase
MKALIVVFSMLIVGMAAALTAGVAGAQDRAGALDKAYEEARAAALGLKEAEARRDQGVEAQEGDRQATSAGGTRPTPQDLGRQQSLEQEVEAARRRYDAALKRWNDLKY